MIEFKNIKWYFYRGALLPNVEPHRNVNLSKNEQKELLVQSRALFLRYTNDWDSEESEFWYVIKDSFGGMNELSSNTRNQVRKGQKNCIVRKVTNQEVIDKGYEIYKSAHENYSTYQKPMSKKLFQENIRKSTNNDFFAVFKKEDEEMIAFSNNVIDHKICNYKIIKLHPRYLKLYPSYALIYEMNRYYLEEKGFLYVSDGARSIDHVTNIQSFLIDKFKFRKAFVQLNIVYRWDVKLDVLLLYPIRKFIHKIDHPFANKVSVLLKQEEIRRSFEQ